MKKLFSLLKATTKGELNVFKYKGKNNKSKILLILILSLTLMFVAYTYANLIGEPLHEIGLTYVLLALFSISLVVINIMEGIYKSEGILFDAKDNNLLFSLPIPKTNILTARIIKLLAFDYIFQILFLIPCYVRYITYEHPSFSFYPLTIIFFILLPLIPLVISSILGYFIKLVSSKFKNKKMIQTLVSLLIFGVTYMLFFNLDKFITNIANNAVSINEIISKIYLPIGLYIDLIQKFSVIKLVELLLLSIVPFMLFIYMFQFKYLSIINNSKETFKKKTKKKKEIKSRSILKALTIKEIKNYFSIPIYVVNTIIGPILAIIVSIALVIKYDSVITIFTNEEIGLTLSQITKYSPLLIIMLIMILTAMTSISSSSISLEGKKLQLTKSLPIDSYKLLLSKILTSDIIIIPFMLISALIMIIKFQIFNYNILFILAVIFIFPHLTAEIGILMNLKYPKLDFNSETEVVKQSFAVLVSMMISILLVVFPIFTYGYISKIIGDILTIILYLIIYTILTIVLDRILKTYGTKKLSEL